MPVIGVPLAGNSTAPFAEFPSIIPGQGREVQGKDRRGEMAGIWKKGHECFTNEEFSEALLAGGIKIPFSCLI